MRTDVCVIGAGPAGLLLAALLAKHGVEAIAIERRDRAHIEARLRTGILEQDTQDPMRKADVRQRIERDGLVHEGIEPPLEGRRVAIDLKGLSGGTSVMVCGHKQIVQDLVAARLSSGHDALFEASDVVIEAIATPSPSVRFTHRGER